MNTGGLPTAVLAVALLPLAACSGGQTVADGQDGEREADSEGPSDTSPPDVAADADADADVEADVDQPTGTLSVLVVGSPLPPNREWEPVDGAAVALDLPGGGRSELTTDATGRVTFDRIDWSAGTAAVTAGAADFGLASLVGLDGSDTDVTLTLPIRGDPRTGWVELSVDAVNLAEPTDWVDVTVDPLPYDSQYTIHQASAATLPLPLLVPQGVPLTIAALEWRFRELTDGFEQTLHPMLQQLEPLSGPGSVVFDFATAPTPSTAAGSFELPIWYESPRPSDFFYGNTLMTLLADPGGHVRPLERGPFGAPSRMTFAADGNSIEYEMVWLPAPAGAEPVTMYEMLQGWDRLGWASFVYLAGYPTSGPQDFAFLDLPEMVVPATSTVHHPLHDPVQWDLFESGVTPTLYVMGSAVTPADIDLWRITAPTDATTLTVPEAPSTINPRAVLGTDLLYGRIGLLDDDPGTARLKTSQSTVFSIQP